MKTSTGLLMLLCSAAGAAIGAALSRGQGGGVRLLAIGAGFAAPWGLRAALASAPSCSFLFVTDTHGPAATSRRVAARMLAEDGISFVLHGGDIADAPDLWRPWWDEPYREVLARWPVAAVTGNHDLESAANRREFEARFPDPLPRTIRCGDADVYLMPWSFARADAEWLWAQIRASTAAHRVLVLHRPIWPVQEDDARQRALVEPVLDRIDLVLAGHDHVHQDSVHGRTRQVLDVSGAKKYPCRSGARGCVEDSTGYLRIDVRPDLIDVSRRRVP